MSDRTVQDAIIDLTDEVERWILKFSAERQAHQLTQQERDHYRSEQELAVTVARYTNEERAELEATLRRERDAYSLSLERAEAVIAFWEAEARRAGMECQERRWPKDYRDEAWAVWDGEDTTLTRSPFIVWFHANRRTS